MNPSTAVAVVIVALIAAAVFLIVSGLYGWAVVMLFLATCVDTP